MTRVGLLLPSTNTVVEPDFHEAVPAGVTVHSARMQLEDTTADGERLMLEKFLPNAAYDLGTARPDVVALACTSAAASIGAVGEQRLIADIEQITGAPVVSTNAAVHVALKRVGAQRVATVTPYVGELVDAIRASLELAGFEVPVAAGMGIQDPFAIAEVTEPELLEFADRQLDGADYDTLFVSCTNLPAMRLRDLLQERYGVPVVTSNQATVDGVLDALTRRSADPEQEDR